MTEKLKTKKKRKTHEADKATRRKARISFQLCGREELKFCKAIALTPSLAQQLGRSVWKIIPREMRNAENGIPVLSIFRDSENQQLIIRCDRVKIYEILTTDKNGQPALQPLKL